MTWTWMDTTGEQSNEEMEMFFCAVNNIVEVFLSFSSLLY